MTSVETIRTLARATGVPAVTVCCPLDRRRPGNAEDRARLDSLVARARVRLGARPEPDAIRVAERLDATVAAIDLDHPPGGVAVFVAPDLERVVPLAATVAESVTIGPTFALTAVLAALGAAPKARVLVCSRAFTRCVELDGDEIRERTDGNFPVAVEAPTEADTPHRDFPLDEHETAEAARFVFRAVRRALDAVDAIDPRPLVLVGTERDLAFLGEVTDGRNAPVVTLTGNHLHDPPDTIAALVAPALAAHRAHDEVGLAVSLHDALGGRALAGVEAVGTAARAGRVRRLVVELGLRTGRPCDDHPAGADRVPDPTALDPVEDIVAEVVRHGGDVTVVGPGGLADLGGIACTTRY